MILHVPFVVVVVESEEVGKISECSVNQIKEARTIPVNPRLIKHDPITFAAYTECLAQLLSEGFYYSKDYDLTTSCQKTAARQDKTTPWVDCYNLAYVWNYPACSELLAQGISPLWTTPVIQVYSQKCHTVGVRWDSKGII